MSRLTLLFYSVTLFISASVIAESKIIYNTIEWPELMSAEDLAAIEAMPAIDHGDESNSPDYNFNEDSWESEDWDFNDSGNDSDSNMDSQTDINVSSVVASAISNAMVIRDQPDLARAYDAALVSIKVRPEFNDSHIRVAGFVVPLEFDDNQTINEFFLVPYFGACIHLPPPPPNQIIHVTLDTEIMKKDFNLQQLYEPVWISGHLSTQLLKNSVATSAYSMSAHSITPYTDD